MCRSMKRPATTAAPAERVVIGGNWWAGFSAVARSPYLLGISGVDPQYPSIVEIEQRYVVGRRHRDEISWTMLVGLLTHELGHILGLNHSCDMNEACLEEHNHQLPQGFRP